MGYDARKKSYSRQQRALSCTTSLGASSTLPLLCMLAPQEGIQILFINVAQMMGGFVCVLLKQLTNERLPCSESVEMVEPMLSVRIRSTDPDTESCSRRRLR